MARRLFTSMLAPLSARPPTTTAEATGAAEEAAAAAGATATAATGATAAAALVPLTFWLRPEAGLAPSSTRCLADGLAACSVA